MRGRSTGGVFLAIGTAFITVTAAQAAGFAVNNKSVSALGAGLAGQAAVAEDASTVFNNPAGMVQLEGRRMSGGLHRVDTTARFSDTGSDTTGTGGNTAQIEAYIPTFYYTEALTPELSAGIGFYSPFGLGLKYDDRWMGRYHAINSALRTYNVSPAIAWRVTPALAVGASADLQYAEATMTKAIDYHRLCGGAPVCGDGSSRLSGSDWASGYSLGITWRPVENTRLGAVFHSGIHHRLSGKATFDGVPPIPLFQSMFTDTDGGVTINLPAMASVSAAWMATDRLTLLADVTRTGWSSYDELRIQFENGLDDSVLKEDWHDSSRYNIGAHYRIVSNWLLRAGFSYDETPVPNARLRMPMLPDDDRRWYSVGARWDWAPDASLDVAFAWMRASHVPIENTEPTTRHLLKGDYEVTSSFVGVQGNWRF